MLETIDLKAKIEKAEYKAAIDTLDLRLAELQRKLREAGRPAMVVFEGWDAAGKGTVLSRLLQPLDPRGYKVENVGPPSAEERMRPAMWRYWNMLPNDGLLRLYDHSWYRQVLDERLEEKCEGSALAEAYERIRVFERQLADDGMIIVKFFLHISKKEQKNRFKAIEKDPAYAWKVGKKERRQHKHYEEYHAAVEDMLQETSTPYAPWTMVPATTERFACLTVVETLVRTFEHALEAPAPAPEAPPPHARRTSPLERADLTAALEVEEYKQSLDELQLELRRLQHLCYVSRTPVAILYEGWDAAGKGGNIRRLTRELDPRGFEVVPFAAPQGEERTHHYLWRFWRALPKAGHFAIFDRTWYGRVLVERIEGFASYGEWSRAYREINEFETQLTEFGMVVVKFWLHVSKEEQLQRFEARQADPHKQWKITEEDWRNRERWDDYWNAVSDMIEQTSTTHAPWTIVEANDKRWARVRALREVIERLKMRLES